MGRRQARWLRRSLSRSTPSSARSFSRRGRLAFEPLEDRRLLKVDLSLAGTQTLVGGTNVNASSDPGNAQHDIALDINPVNPLNLASISQKGTAYTSLGVYRSADGGLTWTTTTIDDSIDALGAGTHRFDPSLVYDGTGKL